MSAPRYYFDANATTPIDPGVVDAMLPALREAYGNASSIHRFGQDARRLVEQGRQQVADLLGCAPKDIVLTGGGTESDNLAIFGFVRSKPGAHVITTKIEHPAVLAACRQLEREGHPVDFLPVGSSGVVSPDDVRAALRPETALVSVMHANNELGTIQPIAEIARIAHEGGALFHTDGVQTAGKIPTNVADLDVDFFALSAHKFYGPKGVGALYVRKGVDINPVVWGGSHERGRRPGTQNTAGIVGLGAAASVCAAKLESEGVRQAALRDRLERGIVEAIPDCWVNAGKSPRTPNTTNIGFDHVEGEPLLIALDLKGFAVSSGAACSSGAVEPSHVLTAIGLSAKQARSCLRFSIGKMTTDADVDALLGTLPGIVERLRTVAGVRV